MGEGERGEYGGLRWNPAVAGEYWCPINTSAVGGSFEASTRCRLNDAIDRGTRDSSSMGGKSTTTASSNDANASAYYRALGEERGWLSTSICYERLRVMTGWVSGLHCIAKA